MNQQKTIACCQQETQFKYKDTYTKKENGETHQANTSKES